MSRSEALTWDIKKIRFWIFFLVICQFLDFLLTYYCISNSPIGILSEGNLLVRYIMHQFGVLPGLLITKTCAVFSAYILSRNESTLELGIIRLLAAIYTGVILSWIYIVYNIMVV